MDVSLIVSATWSLAELRFDYNDAGSLALVAPKVTGETEQLAKQLRYDGKKDKYGENHEMHDALQHCGTTRSQRENTDEQRERQ